jgi:hypothetical protein
MPASPRTDLQIQGLAACAVRQRSRTDALPVCSLPGGHPDAEATMPTRVPATAGLSR